MQELCEVTPVSHEWCISEYRRPWEWTVYLVPNAEEGRPRSWERSSLPNVRSAPVRARDPHARAVPRVRGAEDGDIAGKVLAGKALADSSREGARDRRCEYDRDRDQDYDCDRDRGWDRDCDRGGPHEVGRLVRPKLAVPLHWGWSP